MKKILALFLLSIIFCNLEYSLEDYNTTSSTYGENVWFPEYSEYITLHFFSSQGWAGWTSVFVQLHNFQNELRNEYGFENVVIIAVGQTNISNFNTNFCANSDLPLVMDQYPELPIREAFQGEHKEVVIIDSDSNILGRVVLNNLSNSEKNYIRNIIAENYPEPQLLGDVNEDGLINVLDVISTVNLILTSDYLELADINADSQVDVLDIVFIVNLILNWLKNIKL